MLTWYPAGGDGKHKTREHMARHLDILVGDSCPKVVEGVTRLLSVLADRVSPPPSHPSEWQKFWHL